VTFCIKLVRAKIDLGRRLARLSAHPSALPAYTRAPRKPRTVPPPPFASARSQSAHVVCPRSLLAARACLPPDLRLFTSATPRGQCDNPNIIYRLVNTRGAPHKFTLTSLNIPPHLEHVTALPCETPGTSLVTVDDGLIFFSTL